MKLYEYKKNENFSGTDCVIALGFFDGMHLGHRMLLARAKRYAEKMKLPFGVFTFKTDSDIKKGEGRIYSDKARASLIESEGVDFMISADFSDLAEMSPEKFVTDVLIGGIKARVAVAGFNYRFGKDARGDAQMLSELMRADGGDALICEGYKVNGDVVSATEIRELLLSGEIEKANLLLGAPYRITGTVNHGRGVGSGMGFPTVNTSVKNGMINPKNGVYRTAVVIDGKIFTAITNVGVCPTFEKREIHHETYIIGYNGDLYDRDIEIYFLNYLREEIAFSSEKQLIMQITIDKSRAINEFGDITWQELGLK